MTAATGRPGQSIIKNSMNAGFNAGCLNKHLTQSKSKSAASTSECEPMHLNSPVNMVWMSTDTAAKANYSPEKIDELYC